MDRLVYTSLSSASTQELQRIRLNHDLSNLATVGYKQTGKSTFEAAFVDGPGFPSRYQPIMSADGDAVDMTPGPISHTGNGMDIAMDNKTVLGVQAADGSIAFTRRGDLRGTSTGLVETGNGYRVMGEGAPVTVPIGSMVTLTPDGSVYASTAGNEGGQSQLVGQLMLRDASIQRLVRRDDGLFEPVGPDGPVEDFASGPLPASVTVGALEGSNVNPIEVMVSLLDMYRSFETQMKIIHDADQADADGNQMMALP